MTAVPMVPVRINGNWDLHLPEHRAVRPDWYTDAGWERARLDSMRAHLKAGDTIIDVGAEEGDLPGLWASWGCRVALIEPKPETWANIRAVWEGNALAHPEALFVGFASDATDLDPPRPHPGASGYALGPDGWPACAHGEVIGDHGFAHLSQQDDSIPQTTLDDFVAHEGLIVDAITMDVEGSELRVLHGARRVLRAMGPQVWVSVHADRDWMVAEYGGADRADIDAFMASVGYGSEFLAQDHEQHVRYFPL